MGRRLQLAVVGAGLCSEEVAAVATEVGRLIAQRGAVLVCGGLGGVMEAAAMGARQAGGTTVGIVPTYDKETANPGIEIALATGMGHARNVIVVASSDAVIALPGEHGTASEIALARKLGKPVVVLGAWTGLDGVHIAHTPVEAVQTALARAAESVPK
jgi:hypothetical protein